MTATLNGKPQRKQLGDQLDRLDGIIDLLADALPQAVADACKEGARQALKEAVLELLGNPDVRAVLAAGVPAPTAPPVPPPAGSKPTWWAKLKAKAAAIKDKVVERAKATITAVTASVKLLAAVLPLRRIVLVAVGVGLTVGLISLACPPLLAGVVSAVGTAAAAVVTQVNGTLRRVGVFAPVAE